jgi:hypothetical protein
MSRPPLSDAARRRRRRKIGVSVAWILVVVGVAFGGAAVGGLHGDQADERLARALATGATATAHDAEIWRACSGRHCIADHDAVRAAVDLPDGTVQAELRGAWPETGGAPVDEWFPATADTGYADSFIVRYDPADPRGTVMAQSDIQGWRSGEMSATDVAIAIMAGVVLVGGLALAAHLNRERLGRALATLRRSTH